MAIQFKCSNCGKTLSTPDETAGKKGKCPHCSALMHIPVVSELPEPGSAQPPGATPGPGNPLAGLPGADQAKTPPPNLAGFNPAQQQPAQPRAPQTPGPIDTGDGLTSLPSQGAQPNDGLGDLPDLAPLGSAPTSAGSPLARWQAPAPEKKVNPYASPLGAGGAVPRYGMSGGGSRSGLPWERPGPSTGTWWETIQIVLLRPREAYTRMLPADGFGSPIGFLVIGGLIGGIMNAVYTSIMQMVMMASMPGAMGGDEAGAFIGLQIVMNFVQGVAGGTIGAVIGTFIGAAITHLLLMMLGGANQPYETTFRVIAYANGASNMLLVIPIVGMFIQPFWYLVCLVVGLSAAHDIGIGKSLLAVFLPVIVCCGVIVLGIFAIAAIGAAAASAGNLLM